MKKRYVKFLLIFLVIFGSLFFVLSFKYDFDFGSLTTDSGFDSDFGGGSDFGGSDFGGGFDYDDSSDYDSSDYDSSDHEGVDKLSVFQAFVIEFYLTAAAFFAFANYSKVKFHICFWGRIVLLSFLNFVSPSVAILDIFLLIPLLMSTVNKKTSNDIGNRFLVNDVSEDLLIKIGIKDSLKNLKKKAYDTYVDIQKAWSNNDIEKARDLLDDTLYNTYRMQIMTMINKNQRNAMSDFNLINCYINNVTLKDDLFTIEVSLNVTCKDYMIDSTSGNVIKGDDSRINDYYYRLIFVMAKEVDIDSCPNCHGKITKKGKSVKCEYCDSVINRKPTNLVLVDKKMVRQSVK